ncbi:hypothetical protein E4U17_001189 [Claviceps sp. LM77 group G4]|nr:hypothetical protein E4U17_001189 [Claviceps sp. LM77 group G4]KAG6073781.1 hypothetical protein E4U16_004428 [Claviceps sp. LM84 group G4]KAG6078672.1 hypothetical protein E4U33_000624 [Claviceps sp. LM78 group G4]
MRRHSPPAPSLPRTIQWLVWATAAFLAGATPYPKDSLDGLDDTGKSLFVPRNCASYCGADNQFCCEADQACTTLPGNIATCLAATWAPAYTTTWTVTYTSIIMTHWIPAPLPTPGVDCIPQAPEQEACGRICCAGWQQCAYKANGGQCSPRPGYAEPTAVVITSDGQVTTRYAAPFRVIGTTVIVNSGAHPTYPTPTNTAATASGPANPSSTSDGTTIGADGANKGGTGGGLSPGAIAGIVIGTLAAVGLLMLLCFCCIARGVWNTLFGGHKHRDEKVIVEEERYSHHGSRGASSVHARRDRHAGWFGGGGGGGRPASVAGRRRPRAAKDSDGKWWLGVAGAATAALALLNFKKKEKPSRKPPSSAYHSDSYIYSDVTDQTASSASSGGRTHRTAQTGRSYHSRGGRSHPSHAPSRAPSRRP